MKKSLLLFCVPTLILHCSACSRPNPSTPVVVHLFRDPAAKEVDKAVQVVGQKRLATADNRPIVIATEESKTYREGLDTLGRQSHPDVVILDSPDDTNLIERTSLDAVKTATGQYFICVPSWSQGEERNAAQQVLAELRAALMAQAPGPDHPGTTPQVCHLISANPPDFNTFQFVPKVVDLTRLNRFPKVAYVVNEDGSVSDVKILKGTGSPKVDAGLVKTVLAWKYKPQPGCTFEMSMGVIIDIG